MHPAYEEMPGLQAVYKEPTTLDEAEESRRLLIDEIANITQQLGEKERRHADGKRWTEEEYKSWRRKATTALRARESVLRRVNAWLQIKKREFHATHKNGAHISPDRGYLLAAYQLLARLKDEDGVEFFPEEVKLMKTLEEYLT